MKRLASIALLAFVAGCASTAPERAPIRLTVLHTNDHHGRFWSNADGEYGMAARQTLIDRIRAELKASGGHLLLLDGGDVNTGVPESDLQDAEPDFKGMSRIGYDAMAVGNHEFDKPPAVLAQQRQWATFPLLAANIYRGSTRVFAPYQVFDRGGWRIAVVGLTTDDTQKMVLPANIQGITFTKPIDEMARLLPEVRAKADVVIAATHMGHYPDGNRGVNAPGDVEMARAVKGIDLVIGGHSQNPVCMTAENVRNEAYVPGTPCAPDRQNGAWIVQAHEWGKYVGRADFTLDAGGLKLVKYTLLPVNLKQRAGADGVRRPFTEAIPEDAAVKSFLQPFQDKGTAGLAVPVGRSDGVFDGDRNRVRAQQTNLGQLIARAMIDRTGADLALMNSGGVRDSLPAGELSYRDVLKVQPFGNTVAVVTLTGAELLQYLQAAAKMTPGSGAYPQVAGVKLRIANNTLESAEVGGRPIDPARLYRFAMTNFTASGGDGYPKLDRHPGYVNTGFVDADVLRETIAKKGLVKTADYEPGDAVVRR
jgi:5'-nucleotidase/UDP-sugar diphosphatase